VKVKPLLGELELPGIERIGALESRQLVEVSVPGLDGSYHQDLGRSALRLLIRGTLAGDEARDGFLEEVRALLTSGEPVSFVADITTATDLEEVLISDLEVAEVAGSADTFRYQLTLTEYVEPPTPAPGAAMGFGDLASLDDAIAGIAGSIFDVMQVPDLLTSLPELSDPTPPLAATLDGVKGAMAALTSVADDLTTLFGS
jgi:hypothetical protein